MSDRVSINEVVDISINEMVNTILKDLDEEQTPLQKLMKRIIARQIAEDIVGPTKIENE